MTALPVRLTPRVGEPMTAYAVRLADPNGIRRDRVLPRHRRDVDIPSTELATVAALADLEPGAAAGMTMNRYPLVVRGHGAQRRHGWRLHFSVKWICPACTITTGHTELLWQTALMPICQRCGCYLVRPGSTHVARPADERVVALAVVLAELAETSIAERRHRQRLYRLRRRCHELAGIVTAATADDVGGLPALDVGEARLWGAYPAPDPRTVGALLLLAGHRLIPKTQPRRSTAATRASVEFTAGDRERLAWFRTRIRRHVTRDGLQPCHLPTMLPLPPSEGPRRPGQWLSATRAAIALHLLITHALDGDADPDVAAQALGVHGIPLSPLINGIHSRQGLRERDAEKLGAALDALLAEGLVDYQRRRDTLRPVIRMPASARRRLTNPLVRDRTGETLALGWIWTRYTRGPMRSGPWPTTPDRDIAAFDTRLDPESKLVLAETAHQLLADADAVHSTQMTWATVDRRYG